MSRYHSKSQLHSDLVTKKNVFYCTCRFTLTPSPTLRERCIDVLHTSFWFSTETKSIPELWLKYCVVKLWLLKQELFCVQFCLWLKIKLPKSLITFAYIIMESKHENYGAGESKSTKEIEPVSMLFPVTLKPGNSRFPQLAKQAVDVAQIAL